VISVIPSIGKAFDLIPVVKVGKGDEPKTKDSAIQNSKEGGAVGGMEIYDNPVSVPDLKDGQVAELVAGDNRAEKLSLSLNLVFSLH
jgi:hypothetical protein